MHNIGVDIDDIEDGEDESGDGDLGEYGTAITKKNKLRDKIMFFFYNYATSKLS